MSDRALPAGGAFGVRVVAATRLVVIVLGEHEIPSIEAVLAPVGDDLTLLPEPVLGFGGEEEAAAATVDAHDLR
jgi:hypothetical protein